MKRGQTSGTAMGTAAVRAIESERPASTRICYDPLARQLTATWFYLLTKLLAGYGERRTHGALTFIVCRCRLFDDYLGERLRLGTDQVVILGAGRDSRAYRGELLQRGVKTFEVDHPATQASKVKRLRQVLGDIPAHVTYVPVDFEEETLDKLLACGFDRSLKTLFIWEGVTPYLHAAAVDATLAWVQAHAAPGSALIFDYQIKGLDPDREGRSYLYAALSRLSGERRGYGIDKGRAKDLLTRRGFAHVVDVNAEQLKRLYCTGPNEGRAVAENYAIVHADVGER